MTRWRDRLRRAIRRLTGRRDYLDGLHGGAVVGWALPRSGAGPVAVALYDGHRRIAETQAHQFRADLQAAGLAEGRCGFTFALPQNAQFLRVCRLDGPRPIEIGRIACSTRDAHASRVRMQAVRPALPRQDMPGLAALRAPPGPACAGPSGLTKRQALLFEDIDPGKATPLPDPLCAYMAYLRPRHRLAGQFAWEDAHEEAAQFLDWMLTSYAPMRAGSRPPLSRRAIAWLNAPVLLPGHRRSLSRATWAALIKAPHVRQGLDLGDPDWVDRVLAWWSLHEARALFAEDCLVPDSYVTRLAGIPEGQDGQAFPLSRALLHWVADTPALATLRTTTERDRRQIWLAALVFAADRPDMLRYLPSACIETLLQEGAGGQTPLGAYLTSLDGQSQLLSRADYIACARGRGYDLETRRFTTRTPEGHRLHAASLPASARPGHAPVDVQVIGPVTKASGLGQAMRASIAALQATGLEVQVINFDLDNPAPEINMPHTPLAEARPARFSLLHLNAETIPLFFAYAPDVTDGSYTAAYMFWELTRPATCHTLGLKMIDEIWAASEHGKAIYAEAFPGPIRVMGLANDVPPPTDPLGARAAFVARSGFKAAHFLCLASFDSFSFVQRKNPLGLIRAFAEAFPDGDAQLLLKTQNRTKVSDPAQCKVWEEILALTKGDPRFQILDATLTRSDQLTLMAGADAYLSLHRAEGWGFGMVEAMALGVPVLATGYSGNLAYCDESTSWLVPATEVAPDPQGYMFTPHGGLWGAPDHAAAVRLLRQMRDEPALRTRKAELAQARVMRLLSPEATGRRYATRIETVLRQKQARVA